MYEETLREKELLTLISVTSTSLKLVLISLIFEKKPFWLCYILTRTKKSLLQIIAVLYFQIWHQFFWTSFTLTLPLGVHKWKHTEREIEAYGSRAVISNYNYRLSSYIRRADPLQYGGKKNQDFWSCSCSSLHSSSQETKVYRVLLGWS